MPQLVAAAFTAVSAAFAGATVASAVSAVATYALKTLLMTGVSMLATELLAPKQKQAARQASITTLSLGEQPREVILGRAQTGGTLLWAWNYGGNHGTDQEVVVLAVADHLCDALEGFWVDDAYYAFTADGAHPDFYQNGAPKLHVYWRNGSAGQTFPSSLAAGGGFSPDDLKGVAYVVFDYRYNTNSKVFTSGRPSFKMLVRGKRLYDPRKDSTVGGEGAHRWDDPSSWEWGENAYLCRYNWARGIYALDQVDQPQHLLIGRGLSAVEAPPARAFAPANLCDEDVPLKAGGTEKRYRVGGVLRADEAFIDVEEMFAAAMAGQIIQPEGSVDIAPGVAQASVATITDADLVIGEAVSWSDFEPGPDRINSIIPSYVEPAQNWQTHAAPVRRSIIDIQADGGPHEEQLDLSLVTSGTQAQRCGEIRRRRVRRERRRTVTLPPWFSHLEEGDWISWTSDRHDDGQTRVWQIKRHVLSAGRRITLQLAEISAGDYAWTPASDEATPGAPPMPEATGPTPLELAEVTASAISVAGTPGVRFTWLTPVDEAVTTIRAEVRRAGEAEKTPTITQEVQAGVLDVTAGVGGAVDMEARLVPQGGVDRDYEPSPWIALTPPPLVANDTQTVDGVPAADVTQDREDAAEAQIQDAITRHEAALLAQRERYIGSRPAAAVLAQRITAEAATAAQGLLDEAAARIAAVAAEAEARAAALLAEAEARGAAITTLQTTLETADLSLAEEITLLTAALETAETTAAAAVSSEASARVTGDAAEATARQLLATQMRGSYTGDDLAFVTSGLFYQERTARSTAVLGLANQITLLSAGAGEQFDPLSIWYFDDGVEGWTGNGTPTASAGWLRPANDASDPYVVSPVGIDGAADTYSQVRLRVRKVGAPTWEGYLWWREAADATWDAGRRVALTEPTWDANDIGLVTVSPEWVGVIDRIRVDLTAAQDGSDYAEIDWVSIGRPSPGASTAALLQEQTVRAAADSIFASDLLVLTGRVGDAEGEIADETALRISGDAAEATSRQALATQMRGSYAGTDVSLVTSGLVYAARQAWTSADAALASSISLVQSSVDDVEASVLAEASTRSTQYTALATSIASTLAIANSKAPPAGRGATFPTTGLMVGMEYIRTDLGNRRFRYNGSGWDDLTDNRIAATEAGIVSEATARAEGDNANAVRIDTVFAGANALGVWPRDPSHQDWPTGASLPTNVTTAGTAPTTTRLTSNLIYGEKALKGSCSAVASSGYQRQAAAMKPAPATAPTYVVCEWEVTLDSGDFRRAGFEYQLTHTTGYRQASVHLFDQHASPVVGRTYRGSKMVLLASVGASGPTTTQTDWLWLNNSTLFTTQANAAKGITFHRVAWREALADEIAAGVTLPAISAAVTSEETARIAADEAEVSARTTLAAQMRGTYTGTNAALVTVGLIYSARQAWTSADAVLATALDAVEATVGGHTASITTASSAIANINGRLSATWAVTLDVNNRVSGIKLQSESGGGTTISTFDVVADKFRVFNGASGNSPVFEVSGGAVYIAGDRVRTQSLVNNAVTLAGQAQQTFPTTLTNSPSTGWAMPSLSMTTSGGNVWLVFSIAWEITSAQELFFYVYVDATYAGGASPTGYAYIIPVETSSGGGIQNNTTFSVLIPGLAAGAHTFNVYARNNTGAAVQIGVRTLVCVELKK